MRARTKAAAMFVAVVAAAAAMAEETIEFARYQVILDRKPFGELKPPAPPPGPSPSATAQAAFAQEFRLAGIVAQEGQPSRIAIVNKKTNKSYLLAVGDAAAEVGLEIKNADFTEETATVLYNGEELQLELTAGEVAAAKPGAPAPPGAGPPQQGRGDHMGFLERRRSHDAQEAPPPATPKLTGEALNKHLQDYQLEVIRKGLPPLPIPLTRDQDDQLVREGVLPVQ